VLGVDGAAARQTVPMQLSFRRCAAGQCGRGGDGLSDGRGDGGEPDRTGI
jgi:hypothetical protein